MGYYFKTLTLFSEDGNFEPKPLKPVIGNGEGGQPYHMPEIMANDVAESESQYGMNIAASDKIAMNRYVSKRGKHVNCVVLYVPSVPWLYGLFINSDVSLWNYFFFSLPVTIVRAGLVFVTMVKTLSKKITVGHC